MITRWSRPRCGRRRRCGNSSKLSSPALTFIVGCKARPRLYYQYYRFAFDTVQGRANDEAGADAPELDATSFIQFNYWDTGHLGLLAGEALDLDIKRMEMAYHDNNKRELELTRHVSLRQLDPLALLSLKITGSCTVTVPGMAVRPRLSRPLHAAHQKRQCVGPGRGRTVHGGQLHALAPAQHAGVSPTLQNNQYARNLATTDSRFIDYFGSVDSIVTSSGSDDSGMFETNLHDERFLPFEGAGAISTWSLSLPAQLRAFDYTTISDVILHIRYTARDAGDPLKSQATKELLTMLNTAAQSGQGADVLLAPSTSRASGTPLPVGRPIFPSISARICSPTWFRAQTDQR